MLLRESETIELKEKFIDDIKKEIIAFANCDGGKLYIGVRDAGTTIGVDDPDGVTILIYKGFLKWAESLYLLQRKYHMLCMW